MRATWLLVSQSHLKPTTCGANRRAVECITAHTEHGAVTPHIISLTYSPAGRWAGTRTSSSMAVFLPMLDLPRGFLP